LRRRTGCRIVVTAHTMVPYPEYGQADCLIAVSEAVADRYQAAGVTGGKPVAVIHGGVDTERFQPARGEREALRRELSIPAAVPLVLSVSRLSKKSNVRGFMEIAALIRRRRS